MAKSNKQINKEAEVSDVESTPAVVAYRVAQLEITQKEGFAALNDKLDGYALGFVTEKEYQEAKKESTEEHKRIWEELKEIKASAKWWVGVILTAVGVATAIVSVAIK